MTEPTADSTSYTPRIDAVGIDCAAPEAVARFWQALLGGDLRRDEDGTVELRGGTVRLDFQRVPEGKQVKNRLHLDLYVPPEAREQAVERAIRLGATRADDLYDGDRWQVMRDIEGNEFCFVWGGGTGVTPEAADG
jgi:catechol 2,3-dioxygenase-like lactoylglutathione lyase family enzyme